MSPVLPQLLIAAAALTGSREAAQPGAPGGPGLALHAAKALVCAWEGPQHVDGATVLVRDGRIEAVGAGIEVPEGYHELDLHGAWLMPGMIDLHSHVGGSRRDINDMVLQVNSGLRVAPTVIPANDELDVAVAAGVTTVLYIPGSGTNIGGQGVLMKTGPEGYEEALVRDPGSLKVAQGDNPTRWGYGMGRLVMNFHLRSTFEKGLAYAARWRDFEEGRGERPERHPHLDVFRELAAHRTQISTHTQYYQLVMMSIQMLAVDYGFHAYIDHGSFDSWRNTDRAVAAGVAAILGPRQVMWPFPGRFETDGQVQGSGWGFQKEGHPMVGFNTDSPVIPQESLHLQAAMAQRYGFDGSELQAVRGVTIVPARTAGIDHRLGSLEAGKDADLVAVTGDPCDPRSWVRCVWIDGRRVYDSEEVRRW